MREVFRTGDDSIVATRSTYGERSSNGRDAKNNVLEINSLPRKSSLQVFTL